ncbi:sodium:solute symporter [Mangrovimicrobium sediminis]|uniref:Sodium:solute symporter n=1 Tax=Mangrovimicrobium sediminis TaxID=2562682 RepID=A0A4Z0M1N1_9GAMM|nr:sodium:solute symporter [Haliea sp. SAOS-164]TGD73346.1 sodium:solute symporter [Haliea sp. SAOS-164]
MQALDWTVLGAYLAAMLALAYFIGRRQSSREDYYLGGHRLPGWALAGSIIATQCSTNSLLGAPAFVGFAAAGGLLWLQYELAVPLAMLVLCALFLPVYRSGVISIYAYLERRLGLGARLLASGCFLFFRGVATGVTVYGVAAVIGLITGIPFPAAVAILMGITITYDVLGGMRAVVISDVVQMLLLVAAVILALFWLAEPLALHWDELAARSRPLVNDWGFTTGNNYGFWPMLFGGLFLYAAYYGCDQSQAQRLQSAASEKQLFNILVLNGVLRFPLVLAYCLVGLGLAAYALEHSAFIDALPRTAAGEPNLNLVFPAFVAREFPAGLAGLAIVGLFAAAMSSIDSALNSLSASTVEDFIARFRELPERRLFLASKLATFGWGAFAVVFSFQVESIAPTVLEAINKVGSMANGPLLMLFTVAVLRPGLGQRAAIAGFVGGLLANLLTWLFLPQVSWLWWNLLGFAAGWCVALLAALVTAGSPADVAGERLRLPPVPTAILLGTAVLILCTCIILQL